MSSSKLFDVYGDRGTGKTLIMTYFAGVNFAVNGTGQHPTIADFKLDFPNFQPLEIDELLTHKYDDALVELDEFDVYMNNRRSMSNLNMFFANVFKQSRKKRLECIATAQLLDTIDYRFTKLTNLSIIAIGVSDLKKKEVFNYDLVYKSIFGNRIVSLTIPLDFMAQFYDKYDTNEPIQPQDLEGLTVEIKDRKKLNEEVEKLTSEILNRRLEFNIGEKRVTIKKLYSILLQMDKPESYAMYVSERLNQKLGFE